MESIGLGAFSTVEYLINNGADVNCVSSNDETPLYVASQNGRLDVVKYLVEQCQANVEAKNNNLSTPLQLASTYGHLPIVQYLVKHCNANVESKNIKVIDENELALAFYDGYPVTQYHTLIIPKRHVSDYFELHQPELNAIHQLLTKQKEYLQNKDKISRIYAPKKSPRKSLLAINAWQAQSKLL